MVCRSRHTCRSGIEQQGATHRAHNTQVGYNTQWCAARGTHAARALNEQGATHQAQQHLWVPIQVACRSRLYNTPGAAQGTLDGIGGAMLAPFYSMHQHQADMQLLNMGLPR